MWAWEFLRRNQEYRNIWKKLVLPELGKSFIRKDFQFWEDRDRFKQEFAVLDTPPFWVSSTAPDMQIGNYPRFVQAVWVKTRSISWSVDEEGPYFVENELDGAEALAKFDLRFPLPRQLKQVEGILRDRIKALKKVGQLQTFRKQVRFSKYKNYLRLLDGKQAGASLNEMADEVFPGLQQNTLRVRDSLKAAEHLRDYDYRFLAALPKKL
jgi:hypothetical protein